MSNTRLTTFILLFVCLSVQVHAQKDSMLNALQDIPKNYIYKVEKKIDKYSNRLTSKTEKTLIKLARWEKRLYSILIKSSPETDERLFGNKEFTFSGVLEKLQAGQKISSKVTAYYSEYRDKLGASIKYIQQQKALTDTASAAAANLVSSKINRLEIEVAQTETVEQFIKQRRQQLIREATQHIRNSKYLAKISRESYYYAETLKNYKEIFSDPKKTEKAARSILDKIPAFKKFAKDNSILASIFNSPAGYGTAQSIAGLQTRASVNSIIQARFAGAGVNASQLVSQQVQQGKSEITSLKDKLAKAGKSNSNEELPDFKPNNQRSKTFLQRLEYNANLQFARNNMLPSTADIGLGIGYKLNDKSSAGIGMSYKLGMGSVKHIKFTHQGVSFRTYLDWKLKNNFFLSGGFEMNHLSAFKKISELKNSSSWQQSGLIGLKKKIPFKGKLAKNTQVQVLYDLMFRTHIPISQPFIFRVGYGF